MSEIANEFKCHEVSVNGGFNSITGKAWFGILGVKYNFTCNSFEDFNELSKAMTHNYNVGKRHQHDACINAVQTAHSQH